MDNRENTIKNLEDIADAIVNGCSMEPTDVYYTIVDAIDLLKAQRTK